MEHTTSSNIPAQEDSVQVHQLVIQAQYVRVPLANATRCTYECIEAVVLKVEPRSISVVFHGILDASQQRKEPSADIPANTRVAEAVGRMFEESFLPKAPTVIVKDDHSPAAKRAAKRAKEEEQAARAICKIGGYKAKAYRRIRRVMGDFVVLTAEKATEIINGHFTMPAYPIRIVADACTMRKYLHQMITYKFGRFEVSADGARTPINRRYTLWTFNMSLEDGCGAYLWSNHLFPALDAWNEKSVPPSMLSDDFQLVKRLPSGLAWSPEYLLLQHCTEHLEEGVVGGIEPWASAETHLKDHDNVHLCPLIGALYYARVMQRSWEEVTVMSSKIPMRKVNSSIAKKAKKAKKAPKAKQVAQLPVIANTLTASEGMNTLVTIEGCLTSPHIAPRPEELVAGLHKLTPLAARKRQFRVRVSYFAPRSSATLKEAKARKKARNAAKAKEAKRKRRAKLSREERDQADLELSEKRKTARKAARKESFDPSSLHIDPAYKEVDTCYLRARELWTRWRKLVEKAEAAEDGEERDALMKQAQGAEEKLQDAEEKAKAADRAFREHLKPLEKEKTPAEEETVVAKTPAAFPSLPVASSSILVPLLTNPWGVAPHQLSKTMAEAEKEHRRRARIAEENKWMASLSHVGNGDGTSSIWEHPVGHPISLEGTMSNDTMDDAIEAEINQLHEAYIEKEQAREWDRFWGPDY